MWVRRLHETLVMRPHISLLIVVTAVLSLMWPVTLLAKKGSGGGGPPAAAKEKTAEQKAAEAIWTKEAKEKEEAAKKKAEQDAKDAENKKLLQEYGDKQAAKEAKEKKSEQDAKDAEKLKSQQEAAKAEVDTASSLAKVGAVGSYQVVNVEFPAKKVASSWLKVPLGASLKAASVPLVEGNLVLETEGTFSLTMKKEGTVIAQSGMAFCWKESEKDLCKFYLDDGEFVDGLVAGLPYVVKKENGDVTLTLDVIPIPTPPNAIYVLKVKLLSK